MIQPPANGRDRAVAGMLGAGAVLFVGRGRAGRAMVFRQKGYEAERVSNHAVEQSLQNKTLTGAVPVAFSYQIHGHPFYSLTFPDDNLTWVYDTLLPPEIGWHEESYLNGSTEEAVRGRCAVFAGGEDGGASEILVGDRANGKIYTVSMAVYADASVAIRRLRRAQHLSNEMRQSVYSRLELDVEQGVGEAVYNLRYSDNGGKLFGSAVAVTANVAATTKEATAAAIAGGGTGYALNDILTVTGGTGTAATLRVTSVAGGVIDGIAIETGGRYTVDPTNPVAVTGGGGTGATFNLTLAQVNRDLNPEWRRLGAGRDRVFEIYSDSAVKQVWLDSFLDGTPGVH